ncbi:E4 [Human papillomavirus 149]|uniref:E4 n=1 Tax=Human papillomavirus 149 TaxID=909328 RepID=E7BQ76_9PAPI|nr:E4 [Human papillomavirus 149]
MRAYIISQLIKKKYIMYSLIRMLQGLAGLDCGLLNIKTVKFPLLLSPAQVATLLVQPGTPTSLRPPGRAATPWDRKKKDEDRENPPPVPRDVLDRVRRRATGTTIRRRLEDEFTDGDDEKENRPPGDENNEGPLQTHMSQLLTQWGHDIDRLKERVIRDLDDYKLKLGIPTFCC